MAIRLVTYRREEDIPVLPGCDVFHSAESFRVMARTTGFTVLLFVAYEGDKPVGKLLTLTRRLSRVLPFWKKTVVFGVGDYLDDTYHRDEVFSELLSYMVTVHKEETVMFEFRNLKESLFGYKYFRENGFFPVKFLRVVNSLHHGKLGKWMDISRRRQIERGLVNGADMCLAETKEETMEFFRMMKRYYSSRLNRYFPDMSFFEELCDCNRDREVARVFVVKYKGRVIGGSVCLFSGEDVYLLFSGGMNKTYHHLYPGVLAVWKAMTYAYDNGYRHLEFMNAGLPFKKIGYRDFILSFGGMQTSSRRWYRVRPAWLNRLLTRLYV